ncbi:MAG: 50S ribosomal protein L3 [Candidatus Yanofskybacteria bacterium RIFCSPLOWO2_01_FULL_41_34]|uniref:Large ribosomal subunit protein uL3 n=1 Tax=Candidatus Yanofskybacteria bacterium RIFCSPHIGHO2_01_FULL_41_26 TaxID=1802661 RepID=A0A1F8EBX9_9BACT|nr:MAG: 50S ribosomal protein L3 [Candidatus Yanofskybacteria bacterium RIFCSPHIGHO2_01_FULL_41_26]OGN22368.1 MAG: 50S ribosomal protein L3 [Candidatus Yanofskybacteria bacterium RIFCSPLOWO2_01_FULL_41_34]
MKFILGKKLGMTQVFEEDGKVVPVTVVEIESNVVTQVRTKDKDGYEAVQVGTGTKKIKNINKPQRGHFRNLGNFQHLKEFRIGGKVGLPAEAVSAKVGDKLDVSIFAIGDKVKITGMSKGKGFQGVMKRHGFSGMPHSHGHHHVARHGGSIGQRFPQHTLKGMRMAGRMGSDKVTTRGLQIVRVDAKNGLLAVKGAVPGNRGQLLIIQSQ